MDFLEWILTSIAYVAVACLISWYFWSYKRRDLFGGYLFGVIVAFIGALICQSLLGEVFEIVIKKLMIPGFVKFNFIAALTGAFVMVYILNKINNDKIRKS